MTEADEWRMVLGGLGYAPGFDPNRTYEFKRHDDDTVSRFKLADHHPYFNIANLFYRPLPH